MQAKVFKVLFITFYIAIKTTVQQPEINDQFVTATITVSDEDVSSNIISNSSLVTTANTTKNMQTQPKKAQNLIYNVYKMIRIPVEKVLYSEKVMTVFRNIGTCVVNGFMDLVTYYFPAPFIPLIASAAGMVIPFEPVVMLRRRMPVTSYRRALKTAVNSFLNTFDQYKYDVEEEDPYMTRRFNRRFMNVDNKETKNK